MARVLRYSRDVSEHVHVATPLFRWGWKRHGYTNPPLKATHLRAIDPGKPTSIHGEVRYRADEPHGSTWYLEQINAFLANEKERA